MINLAIFASGNGSNAEKIIQHFEAHPEVRVALVVSNKATAPVLEKAETYGIPTHLLRRTEFYETTQILTIFERYSIDFVVLAGFLWLIPEYLVRAYPHNILNIHPALLPKHGGKGMYGIHVHRAVKAANETKTGMTIHLVNERYDDGAIIFQAECPVLADDTAEDIANSVLQLEHRHYPTVIEEFVCKEIPQKRIKFS